MLAGTLTADRISMKDGSIVYGSALRVEDGNLSFQSSYGSVLHFPLDEIMELSTNQYLEVRDETNRTIRGQSIPLPSGTLNLQSEDGRKSLPFNEVRHLWQLEETDPLVIEEEALADELRMKWKNSLALDLSGSGGNTDSLGIGLRLDSVYANKFRELDVYLGHNNRSTNGKSDLEETKAGAEYDSIFSEDLAWYLKGDFEHDPIERIDLRATGAIGLKRDWIREDYRQLSARAGGGLRYEKSTDSTTSTTSEPALDLGLDYSHRFYGLFSLESEFSLVPRLKDLSDYLFQHDLAILFPVAEEDLWHLRSGLSGTYDSTPSAGLENSDLKYYLSIVYKFQ